MRRLFFLLFLGASAATACAALTGCGCDPSTRDLYLGAAGAGGSGGSATEEPDAGQSGAGGASTFH